MTEDIKIVKDRWSREQLPETIVLQTEMPRSVAQFAMAMIERWGMVAAVDNGEDSAGRSRIRLSTVEELVTRACETASLAEAEFRKRGWMIKTPGWDEMDRIVEAQREKAEVGDKT